MFVFRLPDVAQWTACTQMKGNIHRYVLSTSGPLFDIGKPRYRQNNKGYQVLRIGYLSILDYFDILIPGIDLPLSQLPDITQKTT